MGLLDIFKLGKVLVGTANAVRHQRSTAREVQALPMPAFIERCLQGMHSPHAQWRGSARPPQADAAQLASSKRLPEELASFYEHCDGFECSEDFPARMLPLSELRLGIDHSPSVSQLLARFWDEHGNVSEKDGQLAVLPPDNLGALMTNSAECFLKPTTLDVAVPIVPCEPNAFTVILLAPLGEKLPAGSVIEMENGAATRYDGFKHWLATRATLMSGFDFASDGAGRG